MSKMFDDGYERGMKDLEYTKAWEVIGANQEFLAGYAVARASIDSERTSDSASYPYFLGCYSSYYSLDKQIMKSHYGEEFEGTFDVGYEEGIVDEESEEYYEDDEYDD